MEIKENLNINEMKRISDEIINNEAKKYNVKINTFAITNVEYFKKHVFNNPLNLVKTIHKAALPLYAGGFNDKKGNTVIFLSNIDKSFKIKEDKIYRLAQASYHEIRHSVQETFSDYSYEGFISKIEHYLIKCGNPYVAKHDKYSFEIGANLYGTMKAKEYLEKNYPDLYEKRKEKIEKEYNEYKYDYLTYDFNDTIESFFKTTKITSKIPNISNLAFKIPKETDVSPVLSIFKNNDGTFKSMNEIINNENFNKIDPRITNAIFSSKSFLQSITLENLSIEQIEIINNALSYTNTLYENQNKIIENEKEKNNITPLQYLKSQKSLISKFLYCANEINNIQNEIHRKKNKENISEQLEKNKQLVLKKRNIGFLNIKMICIIGIIIGTLMIIFISNM